MILFDCMSRMLKQQMNVSDEEIQASLNEDASEVIESDTAPDDDNIEDNAENSDVKSDEGTEE